MAIDPAPIKGVLILPPSELKVASVALRKPANRNLAVALTREQFHYGFGNALPTQKSDEPSDHPVGVTDSRARSPMWSET